MPSSIISYVLEARTEVLLFLKNIFSRLKGGLEDRYLRYSILWRSIALQSSFAYQKKTLYKSQKTKFLFLKLCHISSGLNIL